MSKARPGDTVSVKPGKYLDTVQAFPVYLKKGVTLLGELGSGKTSLSGMKTLIKCGQGADMTGVKVKGFKLLSGGKSNDWGLECTQVTGKPVFEDVRFYQRGVHLSGAAATVRDFSCVNVSPECFLVESITGTALPRLRNGFLSTSSSHSCVRIGPGGKADLGTRWDGGNLRFTSCAYMSLCNESPHTIKAYGNTWSGKPTEGFSSSCDATNEIINTTSKGDVQF
jgi:hypothetical protein